MIDTQPGAPRSVFTSELVELHDTVLRMGTFVMSMLERGLQALVEQNLELAEEVRRSDDVADALDIGIEEAALRLLALQHPMASDLRCVAGAIRIAADLERVGDYSKDIAKVARRLHAEPYHWALEDIPLMGRRTHEMIRMALRSFVERDLELARQVAEMDRELDSLWRTVRDQLIGHMRDDPGNVFQGTHLLLAARYLERIGDHTVNVAERVSYMETGRLEHLV